MRSLKITQSTKECKLYDFVRLEQEFDIQLPEDFKIFMLRYGGTSIYENWVKNTTWYIDWFLPPYDTDNVGMSMIIPMLRDYDEEDDFYNRRYDLIPFAFELSQRYFYLSIGKEDFGIVYLSTFSDEEDKVILLKVADSFEAFINNLERNVEQDRKGMYTTGVTQIGYWVVSHILNKNYKEGIREIKLEAHFQEDFECIKLCLKDNRWGYIDNPLAIFAGFGINLQENTVAEAYKCVELLVRNLELEDESQIIEYPLRRTEQETATLIGGGYAFNLITSFYYFQDYKKAISKIKLDLKEAHHLQVWNYLKQAVSEQCLDAYKDSDLNVWYKDALSIFHQARVRLREDTEAEAYRWLELLIRNVELEDESQIIEYPLEII